VVIGVTPAALTTWQALTIASVLFHHSNVRLSERMERVLSWLVATPRMHAIHHSIEPTQLHSNFSSGLAIWDRLHGTARFDADADEVTVGVAGYLDPERVSLAKLLPLPLKPSIT
jgi:sterol desaturase/sphingolipid hydroxylase (fatty acid hydroxylase superfamily)